MSLEKPKPLGTLRLSKSGKAVMIYVGGKDACMVSVKSLRNLLDGKTPYCKVWSVSQGGEQKNE